MYAYLCINELIFVSMHLKYLRNYWLAEKKYFRITFFTSSILLEVNLMFFILLIYVDTSRSVTTLTRISELFLKSLKECQRGSQEDANNDDELFWKFFGWKLTYDTLTLTPCILTPSFCLKTLKTILRNTLRTLRSLHNISRSITN